MNWIVPLVMCSLSSGAGIWIGVRMTDEYHRNRNKRIAATLAYAPVMNWADLCGLIREVRADLENS